ncbi:putative sugar phosphatase [Trypanosoma theileri]|uniref:Putative sugar phosphatase n=1 Tax=Trypanosoma theileri TaxID=67003 RepID=A0A1X0NRL0_9TRYP|nr:putative sugar phosphatase [Trypanosoma theileri]ORC87123.1 putative sugar phosphatase [Trypanosoma theileri]
MESTVVPYKIVATDLDGTLLNPEHLVSEYTVRVIDALTAKGVPVVFATGRHHKDVMETKRKLSLKGYLITSNGACVHDPQNRPIMEKYIEPSLAKELATLVADNPDITTNVYRGESWLINKETDHLSSYSQDNKQVYFSQLFDPVTEENYEKVHKLYYTASRRESLEALFAKLESEYSDKVSYAFALPNCLDVFAKGINKGFALREVVPIILGNKGEKNDEESALKIKGCIAFGDARNDLEMLSVVEKGCLMKNAQEDLLKVAPPGLETIGGNFEDGVAKYLAEVFHLDI